jgi:hypothetical protein
VDDATGWQPITEVGFDHDRFAIYVWRSLREQGDTKTEKSRRTLELPEDAVRALRALHKTQAARRLAVGADWQVELTVRAWHNAGRSQRAIARELGIDRRKSSASSTTPPNPTPPPQGSSNDLSCR